MSWELLDADGGLADSGSGFASDNSTNVCLLEGSSYTMVMTDSYGDGWNGGSFTIVADCDLASGELLMVTKELLSLLPLVAILIRVLQLIVLKDMNVLMVIVY